MGLSYYFNAIFSHYTSQKSIPLMTLQLVFHIYSVFVFAARAGFSRHMHFNSTIISLLLKFSPKNSTSWKTCFACSISLFCSHVPTVVFHLTTYHICQYTIVQCRQWGQVSVSCDASEIRYFFVVADHNTKNCNTAAAACCCYNFHSKLLKVYRL